jgi:hypothetical protein
MRKAGIFIADGVQPDLGRLGKLMGDGHLGDRGTIAAGGDRGVRQAHPLFQQLGGDPASCAGPTRFIKAGRRLVLTSATGNEGQILKIPRRWYSRRRMLSCSSPPWTRC